MPCLRLLSAGIKGENHHAHLAVGLFVCLSHFNVQELLSKTWAPSTHTEQLTIHCLQPSSGFLGHPDTFGSSTLVFLVLGGSLYLYLELGCAKGA